VVAVRARARIPSTPGRLVWAEEAAAANADRAILGVGSVTGTASTVDGGMAQLRGRTLRRHLGVDSPNPRLALSNLLETLGFELVQTTTVA
jgi:hypothetical protein